MTAAATSSSAERRGNGRASESEPSGAGSEVLYVGAALLRGRLPDLRLRPHEFTDPRAATLLGELLDRERRGLPLDPATLTTDVPADVLKACGGPLFLAEAFDAADEWRGSLDLRVAEAAREIREASRLRLRRRAGEALLDRHADAADVRRLLAEATALLDDPGPRPETVEVGDMALCLDTIRTRPQGTSPLPGLLPDEPALVVLVARPKVGKTRKASMIAQSAAAGVAPWPDAPALELGDVAIVTAEETGADMAGMLDRLALLAKPHRDRERWQARLRLYARDPSLDPRVEPILRLDVEGLALLRSLARRCGLVVLDSLSRLKPPSVEEIDNDAMTGLLDELHRIATEERCYLLALHHQGHAGGDRGTVGAGRGASAIAAVARAVWHLERIPGEPRLRRLRVEGNAIADREWTFEVAGPDADPPGGIFYFRPHDPATAHPIEGVLAVGETISTAELARRIAGDDVGQAGRHQETARALRSQWQRDGRVEVLEGGRGKSTTLTRLR